LNNSAVNEKSIPSRFEIVLAVLELVLLLMLAVRLIMPDFLAGQLLPCMAAGLFPGTVFTLCRKSSFSVHRVGFAVGLIAFLFFNGTLDIENIKDAFLNWQLVVPGILIISSQLFLDALRWQLLLRGQDIHIHYRTLLRLLYISYFFNTFIPGATGGDLYRIYRVSKEGGVSTAAVTTSVVLSRFLGLPTLVILILLGVVLNLDFVSANPEFMHLVKIYCAIAGACALFMGSVFFGSLFLNNKLKKIEHRLPGGKLLLKLTNSIAVYRGQPGTIILVVLVSLAAHLCTLISFVFFANAVGIEGIEVTQYMFLVYAGLTINYLPLAPGGAGQGEAAFSTFFSMATPGLDNGPKAATMMLCFRVGMIFYGLIGGALYALGKHHIDFKNKPEVSVAETDTVKISIEQDG